MQHEQQNKSAAAAKTWQIGVLEMIYLLRMRFYDKGVGRQVAHYPYHNLQLDIGRETTLP